jgi:hypothetical protein
VLNFEKELAGLGQTYHLNNETRLLIVDSAQKEMNADLELWLATESGLFRLAPGDGGWRIKEELFPGEDIQVVAHPPGSRETIFAGAYGNGLWRSLDGGRSWNRCALPGEFIRAVAFSPSDPRTVYVGTEPANLYRSRDAGREWEDLGIRQLPESKDWSLPYSPRSGALRTLVVQKGSPEKLLGGVEQGGVIQSTDGGAHWTISRAKEIPADVHFLCADPVNPDKLIAATGDGASLSADGGRSWKLLWPDYTRAVLFHPASPNLLLAGPALEVGEGGSILFSQDGGNTWAEAHGGRAFPLPGMVDFFVIHPRMPERVFAVLSEGEVIHSALDHFEWQTLQPSPAKVQFLEMVG